MKKILTLLVVLSLAFSSVMPVFAANGKVIYDGNAKDFIYAPGSEYSLTDLFPDFKGVMPGDTLTQKITVRNDASKDVKVKIYIRSLGAHADSVAFLSQLSLQVQKSDDNEMAYMFDAAASETAQLHDWVYIGTLYSGGEVNLDVILRVPVELGIEFQNQIGYLDWEFRIEEFPVEDDDPQPPPTGDDSEIGLWITVMIITLTFLLIVIFCRKKERQQEEDTAHF